MKKTSLLKTSVAVATVSLLAACAGPSPGVYERQQPSYTDYLVVPIAANHYNDSYSTNKKHTNKHRIALLYGQKATVTLVVNEGQAHVALTGKGYDKQIISTKDNRYVWNLNTFRSNTFAVVEVRGDSGEINYTLDVKVTAGDQLENLK